MATLTVWKNAEGKACATKTDNHGRKYTWVERKSAKIGSIVYVLRTDIINGNYGVYVQIKERRAGGVQISYTPKWLQGTHYNLNI